MKVNSVASVFAQRVGKQSRKWQNYLKHYDRLFSELREHSINILEIGIQGGGSLEVWAHYFAHAPLIIGCDIDQACERLKFDDDRIKVVIGDITDPAVINSIKTLAKQFDLIIDDGSHQSDDVITTFWNLFPMISDNGLYIVEDLHCSYWDSYGGGLYHPQSPIAFFKKLVDTINQDVWGVELDTATFLSDFLPLEDVAMTSKCVDSLSTVHSIEFVNSMCIIRKKQASENRAGPLVVSGGVEAMNPNVATQQPEWLVPPNQAANFFSEPSEQNGEMASKLIAAQAEIVKLRNERDQRTTDFYEATKKFYEASVRIQELEHQLSTAVTSPHKAP